VPYESKAAKRRRAARVFDRLRSAMPDARFALEHEDPFQLLAAVILSAQCTDARVNLVTPALFARFPSVDAMAKARRAEVEELIRSCGLWRAKAKGLVGAAKEIARKHGGEVPRERAVLAELPGVGTKTAGVVAMQLGVDRAFPVDTHVGRIARRLGFTRERDPDKVERALQELLPAEQWMAGHFLLIAHGRRTCTARAPACPRCPVRRLCPKIGVAAQARTGAFATRSA
jgi:endonuclease-3